MLDTLTRAGVEAYLQAKAQWSIANDALRWWEPRRSVPVFHSPGEVAAYVARLAYTGDPLGGVADFYANPQRLAAAIENGTARNQPADCDDFAGLAFVALRQIRGVEARIVTLVDAGVKGSHVICVYKHGQTFGAIDTNGLRLLSDLSEATLCRTWSDLYKAEGYTYVLALTTPYPF